MGRQRDKQAHRSHLRVQGASQPRRQGQVAPNSLTKFALPWVPKLKGPNLDPVSGNQPVTDSERVAHGSYRLTSSVPVSVYQFNALQYKSNSSDPDKDWSACGAGGCFSFSNDASLLLPTTVLTRNVRVIGYPVRQSGGLMSYVAVTGTAAGPRSSWSWARGVTLLRAVECLQRVRARWSLLRSRVGKSCSWLARRDPTSAVL